MQGDISGFVLSSKARAHSTPRPLQLDPSQALLGSDQRGLSLSSGLRLVFGMHPSISRLFSLISKTEKRDMFYQAWWELKIVHSHEGLGQYWCTQRLLAPGSHLCSIWIWLLCLVGFGIQRRKVKNDRKERTARSQGMYYRAHNFQYYYYYRDHSSGARCEWVDRNPGSCMWQHRALTIEMQPWPLSLYV